MGYTTPAEFENAYKTLFKTFSTGKTKDLKWRKWQLKQLWWLVADNEEAFIQALKEDLNRPAFETSHADLLGMKMDILEHIENLEKWTADARPDAGFIFGKLGGARIRKEPLGVALIIGAWNFPLLLLMQPLIPAIAAGNCVMLKPSELATATEKLLVELVPKYLDQDTIRIVTGGPADTGRILEHRFNHIFFTGSSKVARFITAAAAKHLTPTVLELGGQGPAIVTASADVDLAAKSIALSKYQNAGQICLSTNHVFVDPKIHDEFVLRLEYWFDQFVGDAPDSFTHIVNERNYDRLTNMVEATSGKIVYSGKNDKKTRYMHPTVVIDITLKDSLMRDELFGPVLPVIKADYITAYKTVNSMEHPLAIYIFGKDKSQIETIIANTNSGGVTINDTFMHAGVPHAPFGGVGESGTGYYHGEHGITSFSHQRTIVGFPTWFHSLLSFRYPPYNYAKSIIVKNHLGFKKGETQEDQKIRKRGGSSNLLTLAIGVSVLANLYVLVVNRSAVSNSFFSNLKAAKERLL